MKAAIQSYDPDRLLLTWLGHDGLTTHRAAWRVLPMEVLYAVDLRGGVHSERNAVQAAVAHHACEAARMVGLPHRPQDPVQDGLGALGAFFKCTNVTALTVTFLVQGVEGLSSEAGVAGDAGEALHVEHLLHSDAAAAISDYIVPASSTAAEVVLCWWMVHIVHQLLCKAIQLIFWSRYCRRLIILIWPALPRSGLTVIHSSLRHRHRTHSPSRSVPRFSVRVLSLRVGMRRIPARSRLRLGRWAGHRLSRRRGRVSLLRLPAGLGVGDGLSGFDLDAEARSRRSGGCGVGGRDGLGVRFRGGGGLGGVVVLLVMRRGSGMVLRLRLRGVTAQGRGASVVRGLVVVAWEVLCVRHVVVELCACVMRMAV